MQHKACLLWHRSLPAVQPPRIVRSNPTKAYVAVVHAGTASWRQNAFFENVSLCPILVVAGQPICGISEERAERPFRGFAIGQLMRVRLTACGIGPDAGRFVFGIVGGPQFIGLARSPFAPAFRHDRCIHLRRQENHCSVRAPRPAKRNIARGGIGSQPAMVENIGAVLVRRALALCGIHDRLIGQAV
ncbi:hypothetical protein ACVIHI_000323 [Bradyrhizobium sp. USDA 4524]